MAAQAPWLPFDPSNPNATAPWSAYSKPTPPLPTQWDSSKDPIVGPGPAGTNLHRTKSGRWVDNSGTYVKSGITDKAILKTYENQVVHGKHPTQLTSSAKAINPKLVHKLATKAKTAKGIKGAPVGVRGPVGKDPPSPPARKPVGLQGPVGHAPVAPGGLGGGIGGSSPYQGFNLNGNVGQMLPASLADTIAAGQFDPVINDLLNQIKKAPGQTAQNKHDIQQWMGQVLSSLHTAGTRDAAAYQGASGAASDAAQGIIASLGGSDNLGSQQIGAQGASNAGLFDALGANAASFNADMGPILQLDKEGQLSKQDALASSNLRDLNTQLASAQSGKAGLAAKTGMDITGANNSLAQQRWANKFGVMQANAAAQIAGNNNLLNTLYKSAQIAKIQSGIQKDKATLAKGVKPSSSTFAGTSAKNLGTMGQQIAGAVRGAITKNPKLSASSIVTLVNQMVGTTFPHDNIGNNQAMSTWRNHIFVLLGLDPRTQSLDPSLQAVTG